MKDEKQQGNLNHNLNYNTPNSSACKFGLTIILLGTILVLGLFSTVTANNFKETDNLVSVENDYQFLLNNLATLTINKAALKKRFTIE